MTVLQFVLVAVVSAAISGFTFYWVGVNVGERSSEYYMRAYEILHARFNTQTRELQRLKYDTDRSAYRALQDTLDQMNGGDDQWS